nr:hypothetical protein [Streptomyces sp. LUP30]
MNWTLRSGFFPGDWKCTVTTVIEAGEGMTAIPAGIHGPGVGRPRLLRASTARQVGRRFAAQRVHGP